MLALTCDRARLANGDRILELGCGWGSLSLWTAANYPDARITALSHSRTQQGVHRRRRAAARPAPSRGAHLRGEPARASGRRLRPRRVRGDVRTGARLALHADEAWLQNMDRHRPELMPVLARTYGAGQARRWWVHWRVFFMACAELWGYADGREWLVSHSLFERHSLNGAQKR
jgi:hypothetical protein